MKRFIFFLSILATLSSCKQAAEKVVEAVTESILEPVSVTFSRPLDLGEMAVNPDFQIITMEVKNKSSDDIRKLNLTFGLKQNLLKFAEDPEGIVEAPGYDGTCGAVLRPGQSCTYKLSFVSRKIGIYNIDLTFDYENLIEPQTRSFELKAVIGEPAALTFTNEISNYDFGVIEQTDPTKRIIEIEVINTGGLSARNMNFILENDNNPAAYEIEDNQCPAIIAGGEKCKVIISYRPFNNDYDDPTATYTSKFSFEYQKDPQGNFGKLNVYFSFLSTTIEAKFKQNFTTVEFTRLITGNKETKTAKITNAGYRAGIMKKLQVFDYQNNLITECIKGTGLTLNCQKNLVDYPFIIEDSNSCFDREVQGVVGKAPGEGCFFKFTYWPSNTYQSGTQATHYFNDSTISLVYDSQWKGEENIVTKNGLFKILAEFFAAGKLVLDKVEIENIPLLNTDIIPLGSVYEANLGRLALVSSDEYDTYMKVTLRNTGENIVTIKTLTDGALTPNVITDLGYDLNNYYRSIKHSSCTVIAPGATCNISFNLTPKAQATALLEDNLMYDDYSNPLKKFKRILTSYSDGSSFEDDGTVTPDRSLEVRMIAKLVRKGYLTIEIPPPTTTATVYNFPLIVHGQSSVKNIFIKNVGTGDVFAVIKDTAKNLEPNKGNNFPLKIADLGTPILPATKDCYDILFATGTTAVTMPATPDVAKFLAPNESCSLSIENKLSETMRFAETDYLPLTTLDFTRPFSGLINNTTELWERRGPNSPTYQVAFKYYDGDTNPDVPSSLPYGYIGVTKDINVASSFAKPAYVVVRDPEPITSALFHRPQLNYPSVSSSYPINSTLAAKTVPETYFDSSYFTTFTHGFARSKEAITHVQGMNLVGGVYDLEYKFHAGTFPINQTTPIAFKFINTGSRTATSATLVEETKVEDTDADPSTAHAIQVDTFGGASAKPYPAFSINSSVGTLLLKLNFHPKAAGLYKRCYTLQYGNGSGPAEQYVCVYVEAVATSPKIEIAFKDVLVTQSGASVSETEPGGFTALNTPMNSTDILSKTTFSAVKNSIVYAKKRFKFTNIGTATATKFNYYYMDTAVNAGAALPTDTTVSTVGLPKPCTANKTLIAGDFCEIYVKYMPVTASAASRLNYIGTVTDMAAGLNQFVSYTGHITFSAFDPAKLVVNMPGVSTEVVTDWSNPAVPLPINQSWPVSIGSYSTAVTPPHLLLTNAPTVKSILNYEIKNTSTLKASFLAMNSSPGAGAWNTIFSNADITILANRYCFYGDDEGNGAIAAEDKGFNSTSVNKCYLQLNFSGFKPYESCSAWNAATKTKVTTFGQNIVANCNPYVYTLTYWNYKRAAQSTIPLHMKGFIEPDRVVATAAPVASNVSATSTGSTTGSVTFSWPELIPNYSGWGAITKYRVYYDVSYSNLNTVTAFKLNSTIPYRETVDAFTRTITIPNLVAGKYYYFKVFAVQTYTGVVPNLTYLSNSNVPILTAPIPLPTQIYNHSMLTLIDKTYKVTPGTRANGLTTCTADYYNLNIGGVVKKAYKTMINSTVFNYLTTKSAFNSGYPGEGIGAVPHWLNDNAYNMNTSISLYDGSLLPGFPSYSPLSLSGNNTDIEVIYQKSCNNNASCDQLFKIVGGDGVDLYYEGTFYATATGASAYYRCYGIILCPTNTVKLITDPTCAKP